ncbi:MAG: glucuronate isomerase [Planctomycetes bacterium]|nr:glucuronate isomerase [Planctomycetota bacterium]
MSSTFLTDDFLLHSKSARFLYHEHAAKMPIYDYHCHLIPQQVAEDVQFENITQAWLYGDHYKWRAMRSNGVAERFCTGDAGDYEKFAKWAETVPYCLRNPLYHWTHLELKKPFGITGKLLGPDTAREIYDTTSEMLNSPEFSARNIMRKMNVKLVCTTDDPLDSLAHHKKIADDGFEVKVYPTWRPDKSMATENIAQLNEWIDSLASLTDIEINNFSAYIEAIGLRHGFFHEMGCRMSDHGLETAYAEDYTQYEIDAIFDKIRSGRELDWGDQLKFKSAMIYELGIMDHAKGWVQQFHFGPIRSNSSRLLKQIGPDTGFDSIGDEPIAKALSKMLDRLDRENRLAKTILYNINPRDNELMATMIGNFQDGSVAGKMQFGSGWWFLDQKDGMTKQINALSNLGLLSRFVGMLTDSRSLLSYPRHEYFRRILCDIIGTDIENGELPDDMELLGEMVENICYKNAVEYFPMEI